MAYSGGVERRSVAGLTRPAECFVSLNDNDSTTGSNSLVRKPLHVGNGANLRDCPLPVKPQPETDRNRFGFHHLRPESWSAWDVNVVREFISKPLGDEELVKFDSRTNNAVENLLKS